MRGPLFLPHATRLASKPASIHLRYHPLSRQNSPHHASKALRLNNCADRPNLVGDATARKGVTTHHCVTSKKSRRFPSISRSEKDGVYCMQAHSCLFLIPFALDLPLSGRSGLEFGRVGLGATPHGRQQIVWDGSRSSYPRLKHMPSMHCKNNESKRYKKGGFPFSRG